MYYDVVVNEDYDKACQLYSSLIKVNCNKLLHPYCCFLREAVMSNTRCIKYAYRIFKGDDGGYSYVTFLSEDESENFISLRKFLSILGETMTL